MREITLFDKKIDVRDHDCLNMHQEDRVKFGRDRVNLFIQMENRCNASCRFCEYHGREQAFDLEKLIKIIKEIKDRDIYLRKLNFTGGEPTFDMVKFSETVEAVHEATRAGLKAEELSRKNIGKEGYNYTEISLNTNGMHLLDLVTLAYKFDSIGLSRHHYLDAENYNIFNTKTVASLEEIKEFQHQVHDRHVLSLRCNCITDNIDTSEEVEAYLNHAIEVGVSDCGFVTLMKLNEYCRTHQIDFYGLLDGIGNTLRVDGFKRQEMDSEALQAVCECGNYVYTNNQGQFCKFYCRHFSNCDLKAGQLVYDGKNLRLGFGGEILL